MEKKASFVDLIKHFIEKGNIVLPVFNSAALKVQQELVKKEPDTRVLVNIISGDQSLSSQVLQMANSSFYMGLVEVLTVQAAIVRLGIREVGRISLLSASKNQFHSKDKEHKQIMRKLWQHSVGCAMGAKWLAKRSGLEELESEAFFAALFHDVGKLFVLMVIEQMKKKNSTIRTTSSLLSEAMVSLHTEQGYNLMKKWNIPEKYCVIARDHHRDDFNTKNLLLALVRVADRVCNKIGIGLQKQSDLVVSSLEEAHLLSLSEIDLAELEILLEDTKVLTA
ncbi:MAG: HDOD domain-containing protein [Desulfopila sp.]|nr:HDOD domain-containing protein [Desulfopila sp.]